MSPRHVGLAVLLAGCAATPPAPPKPAPSAAIVAGNEARLLVDGPASHKAMFEAMVRARDHINLQLYILESGEVGDRLAALLKQKAAEGVTVNVLYDSVGSIRTPVSFFNALREKGVAVCEFNPVTRVTRVNNRDHRKILVVDGGVAFTGGVNLSDTYASSSRVARRVPDRERDRKEGWRDTHVRVEGPVAAELQRVFLEAWEQQNCTPLREARYMPPIERRGSKAMQVMRGAPGEGSETYSALLQKIGGAKSRAWLTVGYFVPDPRIKQALMDAARRGVDVRLVVPGFTDFWAPVYAGRSHYEELLASGVKIHEWHDALMHAKTAVVDGSWSVVGSTNLDWRSFCHNYEADLVVHDAAFARELERLFERDVAAAEAVLPGAWRQRGAGEKLKEWFARQWEYLL